MPVGLQSGRGRIGDPVDFKDEIAIISNGLLVSYLQLTKFPPILNVNHNSPDELNTNSL